MKEKKQDGAGGSAVGAAGQEHPALPEVNEAKVVGRLTNAPRVKNYGEGKDRAQFFLAVPRPRKADAKPSKDHITIVAWGALAKQCEGIAKGDGVQVEGRINTWDDRENKRFLWGITANEIHVLDRVSHAGNAAPKQEELAGV